MILPNKIDNEVFRAQDPDGDLLSIGHFKADDETGRPACFVLTVYCPHAETEHRTASGLLAGVVLPADEIAELATRLGVIAFGVPTDDGARDA